MLPLRKKPPHRVSLNHHNLNMKGPSLPRTANILRDSHGIPEPTEAPANAAALQARIAELEKSVVSKANEIKQLQRTVSDVRGQNANLQKQLTIAQAEVPPSA